MANNGPCDLCEANPTQLLITMTDTGDTVGLCPACTLPWAKELDKALKAAAKAAEAPQEAAGPVPGGSDPTDVDTRPQRAPRAPKSLRVVNGPPESDPGPEGQAADDGE